MPAYLFDCFCATKGQEVSIPPPAARKKSGSLEASDKSTVAITKTGLNHSDVVIVRHYPIMELRQPPSGTSLDHHAAALLKLIYKPTNPGVRCDASLSVEHRSFNQ